MADLNEIGVLVSFKADLGNLNSVINSVKNQLAQLTTTNARASQITGKALPALDQQVTLLKLLGSQGDEAAASMVRLAQGTKTFYSVFSGNAKQNLAVLFKSRLAMHQTMSDLKNELSSVQVVTNKTSGTMASLADNWALKTRVMASVAVERWNRVAQSMINAGKQAQWVGRQLIVGITVPVLAMTYALGNAAIQIDRAKTELKKFMVDGGQGIERISAAVDDRLAPAFRDLSEQLGITWEETTRMAASWAAAGYSAENLLVPITKLTEELAALAQGDIDVAEAQELVRNINATYYTQTTKGIQQTAAQIKALQVIQSTTSLQMRDIVTSLPTVTNVGEQFDLNATELTAMIAGMRQLGIAADEASIALRNSFARLARPTEVSLELFKEITGMNLESILFDSQGQPRGIEGFRELSTIFTELQQVDPQAAIKLSASLFETRQYARMNALFKAMENPQSDFNQALAETAVKSENAQFWQEQLQLVLESLSKTWDKIRERVKNVAASLGETLLPAVDDLADSFVGFLEKIDSLLQRFPELASWITKIAGMAALVGPLIYGGGIVGKLLPGNLLKGGVNLARGIIGNESIGSDSALTALANASPTLAMQIAGGVPKLGTAAMTPDDIEAAVNLMAQTYVGNQGSYGGRVFMGKTLAVQRLGAGTIPGLLHEEVKGFNTELATRVLSGGKITGGEAETIFEYLQKANREAIILRDITGETFKELATNNADLIDDLVAEGSIRRSGTGFLPGGSGKAPFMSTEDLRTTLARGTAADRRGFVSNVMGVSISEAARATSMGVDWRGHADMGASKKTKAYSYKDWLFKVLGATDEDDAAKQAADAGETTKKGFFKGFFGPGTVKDKARGGLSSIFNLFNTQSQTAITAGPQGFTGILLKFTSILPELIVLFTAVTLILKNWRSIWEGLKGPIQVVGDILQEVAQIWKEAFDGIFGIQDEGEEFNSLWVAVGETLGKILIQLAEFAKLISRVAPLIAGLVKIALSAAEAFLSLTQMFNNFGEGLRSFKAAGEGIAGVIGKLVAVGASILFVITMIGRFKNVILELRTAPGILLGIKGAFQALGTTGILVVITAIATALSALSASAEKAGAAAREMADSLNKTQDTLAQFLQETKGKGLEDFKAGVSGFVGSLRETLASMGKLVDVSNDFDMDSAMKALIPILSEINQLSQNKIDLIALEIEKTKELIQFQNQLAEAQLLLVIEDLQRRYTELQGFSSAQILEEVKASGDALGETSPYFSNLDRPGIVPFAANAVDLIVGLSEEDKNRLLAVRDAWVGSKFAVEALTQVLPRLGAVSNETTSSVWQRWQAIQETFEATGKKAKQAAKDMKDAFNDALESQLAQTTDRVVSSILEAFDKQTEGMVEAIDKQIEKIEEQNDKEEWLQQQREYRMRRQELLYQQELGMAIAAAERQKAINEGRFDDARIISLEALRQQEDYNNQIKDLDKDQADSVKERNEQLRIERLQKQKELLQKQRDIQRTQLQNMLEELTEFGARNRAEWTDMYQDLVGLGRRYGVRVNSVTHNFLEDFGHTVEEDLRDAFRDARTTVAREAEETGRSITENYVNGLNDRQVLSTSNKIMALFAELNKPPSPAAVGMMMEKGMSASEAKSTYQTQLINKISNLLAELEKNPKHSGGYINGSTAADVPAMLQQGEFVIKRDAVNKIGIHNLNRLNEYHEGGLIGDATSSMLKGVGSAHLSMLSSTIGPMLARAGSLVLRGITKMIGSALGGGISQAMGGVLGFGSTTGAPLGADAQTYSLTWPNASGPEYGAIASRSGTPGARNWMSKVKQAFPNMGLKFGVYNRRYIAGTDQWSQHAWGNAVDTVIGSLDNTTKPWNMKKMDLVAAWAAANHNALDLATQLWRTDDHWNHLHTDFYPQGYGTPPVLHKGGIFKGNRVEKFGSLRFGSPALLQAGEAVLSKNVTAALNRIGDNGGGGVSINVEIGEFFGDEQSYRKLYNTLERVGNKINRERGGGPTILRVGSR